MLRIVTLSPQVIEFVGLSGAGKSTVAAALVAEMRERNYSVETRVELLGDVLPKPCRHMLRSRLILAESLRAPVVYYTVALEVLRSHQFRKRDYFKLTWNFWTVIAVILRHRRKGKGLLVLDQGLLQAVWSVGYMARSPIDLKSWMLWLRRFGLRDVFLVIAEVPPDLAHERVVQRNDANSRVLFAETTGDPDAWFMIESLLQSIVTASRDEICKKRVCRVLTDGSLTATESAVRIIDHLGLRNTSTGVW